MNTCKRDDLINFIFDYLGNDFMAKARCKDDFVNCVQIKGSEVISKISLGVTASLELVEKTAEWGAEFIIVHHGIPLNCRVHCIDNVLKRRLKTIFDNDISLMGLHYPLDAHHEIGNAALILKRAGASIEKPFFDEWGWTGNFPRAIKVDDAVTLFTKFFNHF
jgi:putative NIF3 family GTP cyclohydrolase 1 type 2